jgi:hypothetical protein
MEKILSIEEINKECDIIGYLITTTEQEITITIDDDQQCCEEYGHLSSEDDFTDFIGAELRGIHQVNKNLEKLEVKFKDLEEEVNEDLENSVFINLDTSAGTLQFVLYNSHNGYYGHDVVVKSNQLKIEKEI